MVDDRNAPSVPAYAQTKLAGTQFIGIMMTRHSCSA